MASENLHTESHIEWKETEMDSISDQEMNDAIGSRVANTSPEPHPVFDPEGKDTQILIQLLSPEDVMKVGDGIGAYNERPEFQSNKGANLEPSDPATKPSAPEPESSDPALDSKNYIADLDNPGISEFERKKAERADNIAAALKALRKQVNMETLEENLTAEEKQHRIIDPFKDNIIGLVTYLRTYARRTEDDKLENWEQTIERVVTACRDQLGVNFNDDEMNHLRYMFSSVKCLPAGRFLWQLGTGTVDRLGLASLQNCAFIDINDPVESYKWIMDMLMLGCGVGFNILPENVYSLPAVKKATVTRIDKPDVDFIVPDNREGWVKLLGETLKAHFITGEDFTYSCHAVRSHGTPIKTFGGVASGPNILEEGITEISKLLNSIAPEHMTPIHAMDIANIIGMIVKAGNVRRCLPTGSRVHCRTGMVPIENVKPGEEVLTSQGYRKVSRIFTQGVQPLVSIMTQDSHIECTPEHKVCVYSDETKEHSWKRAIELSEGDMMVVTRESIEGTEQTLPDLPDVKLDSNLAWVFGFITSRAVCSRGVMDIAISPENKTHLSVVLSGLRAIAPDMIYTTRDASDFLHLTTRHGKIVSYISKHVLQNDVDSNDRVVPDFIYSAPLPMRLLYIFGLFHGMGSVTEYNHINVLTTRTRRRLARSVQILLYSCGMENRLTKNDDKYTVSLFSEHAIGIFTSIPAIFIHGGPRVSAEKWSYTKILGVASWNKRNYTYDIEVEGNHQFYCNGHLVHNSAQIAIGSARDHDYLNAKNWSSGRIPRWRSNSNNTVVCDHVDDLPEEFWNGYMGTGEPYGLFNKKLCRKTGRTGDTRYKDEEITGMNPCLTADTWIHTSEGPRQISDLVGKGKIKVRVNGEDHETTDAGFVLTQRNAAVMKLNTVEGYSLRATGNHKILTSDGWVELKDLKRGDKLVLNSCFGDKWGGIEEDDRSRFALRDAASGMSPYNPQNEFNVETASSEYQTEYVRGLMRFHGESKVDCGDSIRFDRVYLPALQRIFHRVGHSSEIINDRLWYDDGDEQHCTVDSIDRDGFEDVYDCTVPSISRFDANGIIVHNCAEQCLVGYDKKTGLIGGETCCLAEIFLPRIDTKRELMQAARGLYKICKHSLTLPCHHKGTEALVHRNMRMGISVTGVLQATEEQKSWLPETYEMLRMFDVEYSKKMGLNESIKLTTCKPSGCVAPHHLLLTENGLVRMREFGDVKGLEWQNRDREKLKVMDAQGVIRPVNMFHVNGRENCVRIRTTDGVELICTPNHRLRVASTDTNHAWRLCATLKEKDVLVCRLGGHPTTNHAKFQSIPNFKYGMMVPRWYCVFGYIMAGINVETRVSPTNQNDVYKRMTFNAVSSTQARTIVAFLQQYAENVSCHENYVAVADNNFIKWLELNGFIENDNVAKQLPQVVLRAGKTLADCFFRAICGADRLSKTDSVNLDMITSLKSPPYSNAVIPSSLHQDVLALGRSIGYITFIKDGKLNVTSQVQPGIHFDSVASIDYVESDTYDVSVDVTHQYILSGVISHNTLSLLGGVTPGIHPGFSRFYRRRIRFASDSPLLEMLRKAGYRTEFQLNFDDTVDQSTTIVEFPARFPDNTVIAADCTAIDQLNYVKWLQEVWSDNAVSVSVYYRKEELPAIRQWLRENYSENIKSVSFILHFESGFKQSPYEEITQDEYNSILKEISPIDYSSVTEGTSKADEEFIADSVCSGGACPLR